MRSVARNVRSALAAVGIVAALAACSTDASVTGIDRVGLVALQSVSPSNGLTGVSVTMPMVMRFSGPLFTGMDRYMAVQEGTVAGAVVRGHWTWSADRRMVTFTPDTPLKAQTTYVIHMGGGLHAADGTMLDYSTCAGLGGREVTGAMMGGGGMMGDGMMGEGWKGSGGNFGMIFTFTTA